MLASKLRRGDANKLSEDLREMALIGEPVDALTSARLI